MKLCTDPNYKVRSTKIKLERITYSLTQFGWTAVYIVDVIYNSKHINRKF